MSIDAISQGFSELSRWLSIVVFPLPMMMFSESFLLKIIDIRICVVEFNSGGEGGSLGKLLIIVSGVKFDDDGWRRSDEVAWRVNAHK